MKIFWGKKSEKLKHLLKIRLIIFNQFEQTACDSIFQIKFNVNAEEFQLKIYLFMSKSIFGSETSEAIKPCEKEIRVYQLSELLPV